jgi:hypothetical protein
MRESNPARASRTRMTAGPPLARPALRGLRFPYLLAKSRPPLKEDQAGSALWLVAGSQGPSFVTALWGPDVPFAIRRRSIDRTQPFGFIPSAQDRAPVAELVDAPDSKSGFLTEVLVRVRPGAPAIKQHSPASISLHLTVKFAGSLVAHFAVPDILEDMVAWPLVWITKASAARCFDDNAISLVECRDHLRGNDLFRPICPPNR